jgi:hypothetical protein
MAASAENNVSETVSKRGSEIMANNQWRKHRALNIINNGVSIERNNRNSNNVINNEKQ